MHSIKDLPEYVVYKMCRLLDENIADLDPLDLNSYFAGPYSGLSETGKTQELITFITERLSAFGYEKIMALSESQAMAASRDLAMFASTLVRWNIPVSSVVILERLLIGLSEKTREIPADTVFSYGARNPQGSIRRRFTTVPEESLFIDSFTNGMRELPVCLAGLEHLKGVELSDPIFPMMVAEAQAGFSGMLREIMVVRHRITPDVFTHKLRPFFEPKIVGGKTYFAPGGAQMPITVIDLMLWGLEDNTAKYVRYWNENIQYLPRAMRSKMRDILIGSSLVKTVETVCSVGVAQALRPTVRSSIDSLVGLITEIDRFRSAHLGVAIANMKIRPEGAVGSGGYDVEILQYLVDNTRQVKQRLVTAKSQITD